MSEGRADRKAVLLEKAYSQTLRRIRGQSAGYRDLALRSLLWIVNAKVPLSPTQLRHALAIKREAMKLDSDDITEIGVVISACSGLLKIDEESGMIRLAHHTLHEYLQQTQTSWFPDGDLEITTICATYLCFEVFSGGYCDDIYRREIENPFFSYAAQHWGNHARAASTLPSIVTHFLSCPGYIAAASQAMVRPERQFRDNRLPTNMTRLHLAAYFGLTKIVEIMLCREGAPNSSILPKPNSIDTSIYYQTKDAITSALQISQDDLDLSDQFGRSALWYAAKGGYAGIVRLLLHEGSATINSADKNDQTPLHIAIWGGHESATALMLEADELGSHYVDGFGRTALSYAAEMGNLEITNILISRGADPNLRDQTGRGALSYAAELNRESIIELLINSGANVNETDTYMRTVLWYASGAGSPAVVKLLINGNALMTYTGVVPRTTPMKSRALHYGYDDRRRRKPTELFPSSFLRELYLNASMHYSRDFEDWERSDLFFQWGPLFCALVSGHQEVVKLLLQQPGIDLLIRDNTGRTALSYAAMNGDIEVISHLLKMAPALIDILDEGGKSALYYAVSMDHAQATAMLIKFNANLSRGEDTENLLLHAIRGGCHKSGRVILTLLPDAFAQSSKQSKGSTLLYTAACRKDEKFVKMLLENPGIDPNGGERGRSPLHIAASTGSTSIVQQLLATGRVDVNYQHPLTLSSPLHQAAEGGHIHCVKALLEDGKVDQDLKDSDIRTPLSYAAEKGHTDIVKLLLACVDKTATTMAKARYDTLLFADKADMDGALKLLFGAMGVLDPYSVFLSRAFRVRPKTRSKFFITALRLIFLLDDTRSEEWRIHAPDALLYACAGGRLIVADLIREMRNEYSANGGFLRQAINGATYSVYDQFSGPMSDDNEIGLTAVIALLRTIKEETGLRDLPGDTICPFLLHDIVRKVFPISRVDPDWVDRRGMTPREYAEQEGHHDISQLLVETGSTLPLLI